MATDNAMKDAQKRLQDARAANAADAQEPRRTPYSDAFDAFLAMQRELPVIPKSRDGYNFKYAPYEQIAKLAFPVMWKHGFVITHESRIFDTHGEVVTTMTHTPSRCQWTSSYAYNLTQKDQERGKSLTYGKRYNTALLLGLSIEGEPDRDDDVPQKSNSAPMSASDF